MLLPRLLACSASPGRKGRRCVCVIINIREHNRAWTICEGKGKGRPILVGWTESSVLSLAGQIADDINTQLAVGCHYWSCQASSYLSSHHHPRTSTRLCCLVTETYRSTCESLARGYCPVKSRTLDLLIASPTSGDSGHQRHLSWKIRRPLSDCPSNTGH